METTINELKRLDDALVYAAEHTNSTPAEIIDLLTDMSAEDAALVLILRQMKKEGR